MPRTPDRSILGPIDRLFGLGSLAGLSEAELIDRYVATGDEAAFEAILQRHGPMVLGVCRRLLRDPEDAEDAFQATFLVLARRARSLRDPGRIGNWLYGVAHRIATKARSKSWRRRHRERPGTAEPAYEVADAIERDEAVAALLDEVGRLPEHYRAAVVLCHLEGRTHEEAARRLGWPVGTVRGRLSRARDLLRRRLSRRGLAGLVPAVGTAIERINIRATVPTLLSERTLKTLPLHAAGRGLVAGSVPAAVAALAEGVLPSMGWNIAKLGAAGALSTLLAIGAVAARQDDEPGASSGPAPPSQAAAPAAEGPAAASDRARRSPTAAFPFLPPGSAPDGFNVLFSPSQLQGDPLSMKALVEILAAHRDTKRADLEAAEAQLTYRMDQLARIERLRNQRAVEQTARRRREAEARRGPRGASGEGLRAPRAGIAARRGQAPARRGPVRTRSAHRNRQGRGRAGPRSPRMGVQDEGERLPERTRNSSRNGPPPTSSRPLAGGLKWRGRTSSASSPNSMATPRPSPSSPRNPAGSSPRP